MTIEYKLPDLGEDIETGDVIGVFVSAGDKVTEEQALLEVETDKAAIEIPAPAAGTIKEVHVSEGDTIKVGQLLVTIDDGKGNGKSSEVKKAAKIETQDEVIEEIAEKEVEQEMNADPEPEKEIVITPKEETKLDSSDIPKKAEQTSAKSSPASPSIRRLARELGVDLSSVEGTGFGGRISEEDIRNLSSGNTPKRKTKKQDSKTKTKQTSSKADDNKCYNNDDHVFIRF